MRALHTAATGMMAQELNVQVISNNIANMRTTGYKRQRAEFQDLLYEHVRRVGTQTSAQGNVLPAGIELGSGVKTVGTPRIMSQGNLLPTQKEFDVAIRGDGFFKILLPDGRTAYTRDGSFELDAQGRVVTAQGYVVQPNITVPLNSSGFTINAQGQVSVNQPGQTAPTQLGQIDLAIFVNKAGLQAIGDNLYLETPASGHAADRHSRRRRLRQSAARQPRTGQRRGGQRNLRPDRRAARLRDERQGHHRGRSDAVLDLEHDALRNRHDPHHDPHIHRCRRLAHVRAAKPSRSRAPRLKELVTVTGDVVRIGDLIDNAGVGRRTSPCSARPISVTPAPFRSDASPTRCGRTTWRSSTPAASSEVVVTRLSRAITAKDIEERIARAVGGQHGFGDARSLARQLRPRRAHHACRAPGDRGPCDRSPPRRSAHRPLRHLIRASGQRGGTAPAAALHRHGDARPLRRRR